MSFVRPGGLGSRYTTTYHSHPSFFFYLGIHGVGMEWEDLRLIGVFWTCEFGLCLGLCGRACSVLDEWRGLYTVCAFGLLLLLLLLFMRSVV
jgi:hypothetical protein